MRAKKPAKKVTVKKERVASPRIDADGLNVRERKFVDLYLAGRPAGRAVEEAGYTTTTVGSSDVLGSELIRKPKIAAVILRDRKLAAEAAQLQRWEIVGFLCDVVRTPVGQVDEQSNLAQEVTRDEIGEALVRTKIKMPAKLDAVKQLCAMLGWNAPEKVEIDATDKLACLLKSIRTKKS